MSFIIDGMDQNHCQIPYLGTQTQFSSKLKQSITGVKWHGHEIRLFRMIDTVGKGANLTIYCILSMLEAWNEKYGYYPEELFIQCDGGSENANNTVLVFLELLVAKRVVRKILFTRLPKGHTHEDVDGLFGVIWRKMRQQNCETLDKYKKMIEDAFKNSELKAKVVDVHLVPNYVEWLDGHKDKKLARAHKEQHTQHQWSFEAVKISTSFPAGVKTMHRAFSSNTVVEFRKMPKMQCITPIGQAIGLEPATLMCKWFPTSECFPTRAGIEGFYIMRGMPHVTANENLERFLPPDTFSDPNIVQSIQKTLREVRRRFDPQDDMEICSSWNRWQEHVAPLSNDATEYITRLQNSGISYHEPLKHILYDRAICLNGLEWEFKLDDIPRNANDGFEYPPVLAAAMNSVASEFNPHPGNPRVYSVNDQNLTASINRFRDSTQNYYRVVLEQCQVTKLQAMLKRKVEFSGEVCSTTGELNGRGT